MAQLGAEDGKVELELAVPQRRPIMYNLDPDQHTYTRNQQVQPRMLKIEHAQDQSKAKAIVSFLFGIGAGFLATLFFSSALVIAAIAGGAVLLAWECVEVR